MTDFMHAPTKNLLAAPAHLPAGRAGERAESGGGRAAGEGARTATTRRGGGRSTIARTRCGQ